MAAKTAIPAEIRLYENLIDEEKAEAAGSVYDEEGNVYLNPNSLVICHSFLEPAFAEDAVHTCKEQYAGRRRVSVFRQAVQEYRCQDVQQ